jgi:DNA-directed RNA polymerase specialized sigma24 family protein
MNKKTIERLDKQDKATHKKGMSLDAPSHDGHPWVNDLREKEYDPGREHPTPEQLLIREAAKWLTTKQKRVWELHNYDKFTQDEIAKKLGVTQQAIQESVKAIEKRIAKWVKGNLGAYELLKADYGDLE